MLTKARKTRMNETYITLVHPGADSSDDETVDVIAAVNPVGRDEFRDAGINGYKAEFQFVVWADEYDRQPEVIYGGRRLSIYRTYGVRSDGKVELYAAERVGNYGR